MSKPEFLRSDSSIGINLAAGMVIFTLLGLSVDKKIGSGPWGLLSGIGLGLVYAAYEIWKLLRKLPKGPNG